VASQQGGGNVNAIYRTGIANDSLGQPFQAPRHVTFGFQHYRDTFSVWWVAPAYDTCTYVVLATGQAFEAPVELVASVVLPDGFTTYHLCRVLDTKVETTT
jgi:hypothetical protein